MFDSNGLGNIISINDPRITESYNNIAIILLVLIVFWNWLYSLFVDMDVINNNYLSFCWAICCFYYLMLDDHIKYYATNVLQIKKSKIDIYELAARNNHISRWEKNVMEQANLLKPSNAEINNIDKQFIKIRLETDVIIKSLAIFTIYNWQSADVMNSLAFPTALYM